MPDADPVKPATEAAPAPKAEGAPAADPKAEAKAQFDKAWADFKAPQGYDAAKFGDTMDYAKKLGLPPQAAVVLFEREKQLASRAEAEDQRLRDKGWMEEFQQDKELGGEKARETMVDVMRAHDKLPKETQEMIKEAGVLYNPVVLRILHAVGKQLREDNFVRPGATPGTEKPKSLDERFVGLFGPRK